MIPHQPCSPLKLRIWQQNAHKSLLNMDYILNQANPKDFDLLLIQEPWFNHLGNFHGIHNWQIIYLSTHYLEHHDPICSLILVNTNITTDTYSMLNIPSSNISII